MPDGIPIPSADIIRDAGVEAALLPDSYRVFLSTVGLGYWKNDSGAIVAPAALYGFDAECRGNGQVSLPSSITPRASAITWQ